MRSYSVGKSTSEAFPDLELKAKESVNTEKVTKNCDFSICEDQRSLAIATCNVPLEIPVCSSELVSNDITQDDNQLDCTWSEDESSVVSDTDLGIKCNNTDEDSTSDDLTEDQEDIFSNAAVLPLYEGSSNSVLHTLVKYFHWFSEHPGISKEAFSSMLAMQSTLLPPENNLPTSYEAARRPIEPHLTQPIVYDVCKNDCIIFRGKNAELAVCPKCGCSRYVSEQSHTAVRSFTYLPLKPRLARMFGNSNMAQVLQSHAIVHDHNIDDSHVVDIQQSKVWKDTYHKDGIFEGDPRGISLALCTDGVNPFAHNRVSYSMWPIMLTLLNLPRHLRNRFASIMLVGIIPSNGSHEPQSLNPYLDVLVDELLELCSCTLYDAYQQAPFNCKVALLLHILDYPGMCKVMSVVGSGGDHCCMFCNIEGVRDQNLNKTVYLQNRRFLPKESSMRKDKRRYDHSQVHIYSYVRTYIINFSFPGGREELNTPPSKKKYEELVSYHKAYDNAQNRYYFINMYIYQMLYIHMQNRTQANLIAKHTGCKGIYPFMRLPHHNRIEQTVPDAMHTVKDCVEKVFHLITGK